MLAVRRALSEDETGKCAAAHRCSLLLSSCLVQRRALRLFGLEVHIRPVLKEELPQQEQERGFDNLQQRNAGAGALSCPVAAYRSCPGQPPCGATASRNHSAREELTRHPQGGLGRCRAGVQSQMS